MEEDYSFAFVFFLHKKHCLSLAKVNGGEMIMIFLGREGEKAQRHRDNVVGFGQRFVVYIVLAYSWE